MDRTPLVIDLDGTLIRSDLLIESTLYYLRNNIFKFFNIIIWLSKGKAHLKRELSQRIIIDPSTLPYNTEVLELIKRAKNAGRPVILATASDLNYAQEIAAHLGCFDEVLGSDGVINLSSEKKADALIKLYGEKKFDYAGNSKDDLSVWNKSRYAIVVNPDRGILSKATRVTDVSEIIDTPISKIKIWLKALRLHQWAKNILIFVPLLASHQILDLSKVFDGIIAFILFGFCASSVYLLNDLVDIQDDRHHPSKCRRPFASGSLSIQAGVLVAPVLLFLSFAGALTLLPVNFLYALVVYYILTLLYSFILKRIVVVDVITLALLYTMRMIAGIFAFDVALTFWMLAFSMFIFLSLALVKRFTELLEARNLGKLEKARGRGYYPDDIEMISSLGGASGYISVLVLALYIQDETTVSQYTLPELIWLACPILLFWISRVWLLAHRGKMNDDPVVFAIKDKASLVVGILFGLVFWLAI